MLRLAKLSSRSSLEGFRHAFALASSRAFMVDAYHGLAMVPIADAYVPIIPHRVILALLHRLERASVFTPESTLTLAVAFFKLSRFNHSTENHIHLEVRNASSDISVVV